MLALTIAEISDSKSPFILQGRPFEESIRKAAEYGFQGIELQARYALSLDNPLICLCDDYKIRIVSIATGQACKDGLFLSSSDYIKRNQAINLIKENIAFSANCNHHPDIMIGLLAGNREEGQNRKDFYYLLGSSLKEISDYAKDKQVNVNLEPVNHLASNALNTWDQTVELLDEFHCDQIKIGLDLFHMRLEEENIERTIQKYEKRIGCVQLMDDNRKAPGLGNFRFESLIRCIKQSGYGGPIIMECLPEPDPETAMRVSRQFYCTYF